MPINRARIYNIIKEPVKPGMTHFEAVKPVDLPCPE